MDAGNSTVRMHYNFVGRVQGVGFRYTAYYAAKQLGLTGFVENEYDGSVTMEIQGTEAQIDRVVQAIGKGLYVRVERTEEKRIPTDPDERDFRTR